MSEPPGSYAHLKSSENYVVHILRRACLGPQGKSALSILGRAGPEFFGCEIEPRVRSGFECRTAAEVEDHYAQAARTAEGIRGVLGTTGTMISPPALAAFEGDAGALDLLMQAGYDLRRADYASGRTYACIAAWNGHEACLRLLDEAGCDILQEDRFGVVPTHVANVRGHKGCLRLLEEVRDRRWQEKIRSLVLESMQDTTLLVTSETLSTQRRLLREKLLAAASEIDRNKAD